MLGTAITRRAFNKAFALAAAFIDGTGYAEPQVNVPRFGIGYFTDEDEFIYKKAEIAEQHWGLLRLVSTIDIKRYHHILGLSIFRWSSKEFLSAKYLPNKVTTSYGDQLRMTYTFEWPTTFVQWQTDQPPLITDHSIPGRMAGNIFLDSRDVGHIRRPTGNRPYSRGDLLPSEKAHIQRTNLIANLQSSNPDTGRYLT